MKYVNLGRSGLKVSRLCLGCMSYGEPERLPQPATPRRRDHSPASGYATFTHPAFSNTGLLMPYPGPALPGPPGHSCPVTDVKREAVPARMRPIEKSWLHQVRSRCW